MDNANKLAASAHEKVMMNLAIFHLLLPVAALSSGYMMQLLSVSVLGSLFMLIWIYWRSRHMQKQQEWVAHHWQLAWQRCKLLLLSYLASAAIMGLGLLISSSHADHNMATIMLVVFSRIAAVPVVLMVLVLFVMETTSLSQARQGQEPD